MDNNSKKSSPVRSVVSEIGIAALLVVLILGTLNYFRILPVSQSFPILSFLPQQPVNSNTLQLQTQEPNRNNIKTTVNSIVRPYAPLKIENNTNGTIYKYVASSSASIRGQLRIDIEMLTSNQASTSGVIFTNGIGYAENAHRSIRIFRDSNKGNWMLEYRGQVKSTYVFLDKAFRGADYKKFSLVISPDGKSLTIISPAFPSKALRLPGSLYEGGNKINANTQVGPRSTLTIFSLSYQLSIGAL